MKVNIKSLPKGYSIVNGKVYRDGGSTTGDQSNYGLVQFPLLDDSPTHGSPFDSVNYSLSPVPREEANLEAEKGETVLTDMNNDGDFELYDIPGKRHHKGGTPLNLPPQSFIYSDTPKMKLSKHELAEMNLSFPTKMTPAKVSKMYQLNNFIGLLDDHHSDKITKDTANYMLDKNKRSLSQLAFLQEAKKEFEDGVPLAAYPYLTEKGIDPIDFSQKVEDISRQEAEQKMLMQLPIEEQLQILIAKQQLQEQQNRQAQQNELVKQGQMPPSMMNEQAPNPQDDMAMQQMNMQAMAPQGMMPPQMPMQGQQGMMPPPQQMQQPAMARRGGQISLLQKGGDTQSGNMYQVQKLNEEGVDVTYDEFTGKEDKGYWGQLNNMIGQQVTIPNYSSSNRGEISFKFTQDHYDQLKNYYNDVTSFGLHNPMIRMTNSTRSGFDPIRGYAISKDNLVGGMIAELSHGYDWGRSPLPYMLEGLEAFATGDAGYDNPHDVHGEGAHAYGPVEGWFLSQFAHDNPSYSGLPERSTKKRIGDFFDFGQTFSGVNEEIQGYDPTPYMNDKGVNPVKFGVAGMLQKGLNNLSFDKAFNLMYDKLGEGNTFTWRDKEYLLEKGPIENNSTEYNPQSQGREEYAPQTQQMYGGIHNDVMARYGSELPQFGWGSSLMDWGQGALSIAGMIPGVGIIADAANTAISGGRAAYAGFTGDTEGAKKHSKAAALNAVAMIPGVGQVATATKGVKGAANIAKNVGTDAIAQTVKYVKNPSKIANKYVNAVTDIGKLGDNVMDTAQATGQTASLYKKGDFVTDEVQGEGKFNKSRQYGEFEDVAQSPEQQVELSEATQTDDVASISADVAAGDQVASMDATDIMDTQTQPIEEASMEEEEIVNTEQASIDTEEYTPQAESEDEEYSPQSMAAWGYEIPKLQKGGYDAMLDAQVRNKLNIDDNYKEKIKSGPESNAIDAPVLPYAPGYGQASMDPFQANLIYDAYKTNIDSINSVYNNNMLSLIDAYKNSVVTPSMEQQMMMLGVSSMQQVDEDMVEVWEEHIESGGSPPNEPDINYTQAYKNINGEDSMPTYKNAAKNQDKPNQTITNVYTTPNQKMDDLSSSYINEAIMRKYGQNPYPTEGEDEQSQFMQYLPKQRRAMLDFDDPSSPYYAGTNWTLDNMKNGGDVLPKAQLGGDPNSPGYYAPYTIKEGENATQIAYDWNLNLKTLLEMNPQITDPSKIYPGQEIEIGFPSFYRRPNTPPGDPAFWPDDWETNFQEEWYRPSSGYDRSSTYPGNYKYGGDVLPTAQRGKETITFEGEEYDRKRLKKLYKKNPALYNEIMGSVKGTQGRNKVEEINEMRQDIEATEETTQYLTSGDEDWNQFYEGDTPEATKLRDQRYNNYLEVAAENDLTPISAENFHKNYVTFQKQNQWMNQNISKDDLDNPGWDKLNEYTPCADGDTTGCEKINGKYYKKGDKKEANWRYNQAMEEAGMDAFDQDMIKHMQAGYIGGKMMEMSEEELAQLKHEGVGDQTWQGFAISGVDGFFGNTTNRQIEGREEITPGTEAQPCANAEEMQAACAEAGGTWTPYNAEEKSGCSCSKPIDVPEQQMIEEKDTPFWLQDELAIGNALDDKLSLKKRYPWSPFYQKQQIDGVFKDPTREIAAIGEMAAQATDAATAFGGGPQRAMAAALAAQGQAMKGISDAVNKVQGDNVTVANNINTKNAELEYKTQLLNNAEAKSLYDNTVLTDENYDNALRKANAKLTKSMQNAYTNRANTANLNSIYPQFDIDPASGGMINITDPKAFYADSNYQDPKTYLENYTSTIDELKRSGVPEDQWPKYQMPNQTKGPSFAQQNQQAITSGGYQGKMGREMRLARKRMALRNFFGK